MKKKFGLFCGLLLGFCSVGCLCAGAVSYHSIKNEYVAVYAEPDSSEPMMSSEPIESSAPEVSSEPVMSSEPVISSEPVEVEEEYECKIVWGAFDHGTITADKMEGHAGDIVTLTAKHDLFYLVDYVAVNGTNLVEDEDISGVYKFALAEGENRITAKFIVDKELLGEMSSIYEQAANKDWTNLFTIENVVRVVSFLLSGGLLIAMVRYFVKDKKIAKSVETSVSKTCSKIIPQTTKEVVLKQTEEVLKPIFEKTYAYQQDIVRVMGIIVKCIALMQEDTPDSKRAILAELANLNIGDMQVIEDAKKFIEDYFDSKMKELNGVLTTLDEVIEKNKEVADKAAEAVGNTAEENSDGSKKEDGTQI